MDESQVFDLISQRIHFVDVTDGHWDTIENSIPAHFAPPIYPTTIGRQSLVSSLISKINKDEYKAFIDQLSSFNNRYYKSATGVQSAQFIYDQLVALATNSKRTDVKLQVEKFNHPSWGQFSVIARLSVTNDTRFSDRIVLGAHQDSINLKNPSSGRAPGYDDDGTGCANNFILIKLLLQDPTFVPKKPIEAHFYSAEEVGLKGSQEIVSKYTKDKISVYAMLNSDMVGYATKSPYYAIVTDNANSELTNVLRMVAKTYQSLPLKDTTCNYACSDHASWDRASYPVAHHHEATGKEDNPHVHSDEDVFTWIALSHALEFLKSSIGFTVELALF
jgi:leucyl aminopeptidase